MLMAPLVSFSTTTLAIFGLTTIAAQNLIGPLSSVLPQLGRLWQVIYFGGVFPLWSGGPRVAVLYSIVPWIGVMATGYAFGAILTRGADERRRLCLRIGLAATALFLAAGTAALVLNPAPNARPTPALFRLLNQQKYPASQLFLLMTLGPTIALLPAAESLGRLRSGAVHAVMHVLAVFGRVPLFYYLLHIPAIHAAAMIVSLIREGRVNPWLFGNHPMMPPPLPPGYMWSLPLLYVVFAIVIAVLYVPCAWFARVKAGHREGPLRYL
jgi:uncharacterized membrane protein